MRKKGGWKTTIGTGEATAALGHTRPKDSRGKICFARLENLSHHVIHIYTGATARPARNNGARRPWYRARVTMKLHAVPQSFEAVEASVRLPHNLVDVLADAC